MHRGKQKSPGDAGALIAGDTRRKSVSTDVKQIVGAHFEDLLGCGEGRSTGHGADVANQRSGLALGRGHLLRAKSDIIVFTLDGPITRQRVFNAHTNEKTVQSAVSCEGVGSAGSRTAANVYSRLIEFAPRPAPLDVDQRAVKGDTNTSGNGEVVLVLEGSAERIRTKW